MSRASAAKAKLQLLHSEIIANWAPHTMFVSICQLPLVHVGPAKERQPKALEIHERYPCTMAYTPDSPRDAIATQDAIHTDIFMDCCLHHSYEGGCMSDWVTRSFLVAAFTEGHTPKHQTGQHCPNMRLQRREWKCCTRTLLRQRLRGWQTTVNEPRIDLHITDRGSRLCRLKNVIASAWPAPMCSFQPDKGYRVAPAAPYQQQQQLCSSGPAVALQQCLSHPQPQKKAGKGK
jgi:hypothetical protein